MARSNNQSDAILRAATEVIAKRGAGKLTIDSVAKQAGMSKGGVLYHFATKDALLAGMLDALIARIDGRRKAEKNSSALSSMLNSIDLADESERYMSLAILAASAEKPELLTPAKTYLAELLKEVTEESNDQHLSSILLLALEGMRFLNMLDLTPWTQKQTRSVLERMQKLGSEVST